MHVGHVRRMHDKERQRIRVDVLYIIRPLYNIIPIMLPGCNIASWWSSIELAVFRSFKKWKPSQDSNRKTFGIPPPVLHTSVYTHTHTHTPFYNDSVMVCECTVHQSSGTKLIVFVLFFKYFSKYIKYLFMTFFFIFKCAGTGELTLNNHAKTY